MNMKNWEWKQATEEDFELHRHSETYYRIFYTTGSKMRPKKVTVYKYWAKDRDEAYSVLKAYKRAHPGREYYYGTSGYFLDAKGTRYDDPSEMLHLDFDPKNDAKFKERRKLFRAERNRLFGGLRSYIKSLKIKDEHLQLAAKDITYFIENYDLITFCSHQMSEACNIRESVLDMLTFNLPLMIAKHPAVPNVYCERACLKLKEKRTANGGYSPTVMKLAETHWRKELERLQLYVNLFRFYDCYGHFDERKPEEAKIIRKYGKTVPYHRGTYKDINYEKLSKLKDRYWMLWTKQFQRIGQDLRT